MLRTPKTIERPGRGAGPESWQMRRAALLDSVALLAVLLIG